MVTRLFAIGLFVAVIAASAAQAAPNKEQWGFVVGRGAILFYGVPESHAGTMSIICQAKRKEIEVLGFALPDKPRTPRVSTAVKIALSNGNARLEYAGKIGRDPGEEGSYYARALASFDGKLFDFLGTGSTLVLDVGGKRLNIPLRGIAKPLAQMRRACLGKA